MVSCKQAHPARWQAGNALSMEALPWTYSICFSPAGASGGTPNPPFLKGLWRPFWPQGSSPPPAGAAGPGSLLWFRTPKRWKPCLIAARVPLPCWAGAKAAILVFADPEKTDVWTEDCAIAMSNMHLMAHHLGLGSCWIQGRLRQAENGTSTEAFCRALLSVPARYTLEAILSLGFPAIQPEPHSLEDLPREKIHWDTF